MELLAMLVDIRLRSHKFKGGGGSFPHQVRGRATKGAYLWALQKFFNIFQETKHAEFQVQIKQNSEQVQYAWKCA